MKILRMAILFGIVLAIISCAMTKPEFEAGRRFAEEFAKQDAMQFNCNWYPPNVYATFGSRKYTEMLRNQGRSLDFVEGFYYGYELGFKEYLGVYCGP